MMNTPRTLCAPGGAVPRVCFLGMIEPIYNRAPGFCGRWATPQAAVLIAASMTNIVLGLLFVVGLRMGVLGVALGTVSQCVAAR